MSRAGGVPSSLPWWRLPLWRVAEGIPWIGANLTAVRTVATASEMVASEAVRPLIGVATEADARRLDLSGGRIDLAHRGTNADALAGSVRLAQAAERLGYGRFWVAENHGMPAIAASAPAVLIAGIAAATERIRVASGGVILPNHAPLVVAEHFGAVRALCGSITAVPGLGDVPQIWLLGSSGYSAQVAAALGLPFAFAHHFAGENTEAALEVYRSRFRVQRHPERTSHHDRGHRCLGRGPRHRASAQPP
ncbi:LLM class flavin-dependent oxidoreductase [Leifsonia xyli]|uniref:LLM class flavin-dependent oxidoreductase n=1 Tax=Leifsonia xyli TaxID=1575 RepID=UPI0002FCED51|nr:LLM class flavin-dependent oxidoreductase [Leifsonia xyli]